MTKPASGTRPAGTSPLGGPVTYQLTPEQLELGRMVNRHLYARDGRRMFLDEGPALERGVWQEHAKLGLLGLLLSDDLGGPGGSLMDQVIVAEAVGRHNAAIPVTTSAVAATLLSDLASPEARHLATVLSRGDEVVLAAMSAARGFDLRVAFSWHGSDPCVTGEVVDLLEGAAGDVFVVRATDGVQSGWFAVNAGEAANRSPQPSLDPSQRLQMLRFDRTRAQLLGWDADGTLEQRCLDVALTLLSAQATGAADRALELSVAYALQRKAFGHQIGYFQAIKHRLADMLLLTENARSAVYNAAWAYDHRREDGTVAAHMAKAVATENAVRVVHDAIQTHGGVGFTWEHDLHLHLRRAKTCAVALGSPDAHFDMLAASVLGPPSGSSERRVMSRSDDAKRGRRTLDVAADLEFREELVTWLEEHVPKGWGGDRRHLPRNPERRRVALREWQAEMASGHWVGIHWPKEHGGRDATLGQQVVYAMELAARGMPALPGHRGLTIVGPTLIKHGTDEQRDRFLERIRRGDDLWAGGFSEPDAGSDLAALRTRGDVDGDEIVINGQKIWTSSAHWSDWIYTLVRTDQRARKHRGISVVAVPLDTRGITVRPIRQMNGAADFNEVFFDDVVVPLGNVIGPLNEGWRVNRTTLSHEHFTLFIGAQARLASSIDRIVELALETPSIDGGRQADDAHLRNRLARSWCKSQLLMVNGLRNVAKIQQGSDPGPEGSISKLFGQETEKELFELAFDVAGPHGLLDRGAVGALGGGRWLYGYLGARAATIGGGTSEIHRSKIAEGILGMPRDAGREEE